jgi:hypothetical protein
MVADNRQRFRSRFQQGQRIRDGFGYDAVDTGEGKRRVPSGVTRSEDDELPVQKRRKLLSQTRDVNGSANTARPMGMGDPSGRFLTCDYGASGGISDHASRIASLIGGRPPSSATDCMRGAKSLRRKEFAFRLISGVGTRSREGDQSWNANSGLYCIRRCGRWDDRSNRRV